MGKIHVELQGKRVVALRDCLADAEAVHSVLRSVERDVRRLCADLPENLKLKRGALATEERKIANFVEFIGDGKVPVLWLRL
jgi:hypothetical protein